MTGTVGVTEAKQTTITQERIAVRLFPSYGKDLVTWAEIRPRYLSAIG